MKVLHVLNSRIYSGAEKVACQIIKSFRGEIEMVYTSPVSYTHLTLPTILLVSMRTLWPRCWPSRTSPICP